MTRDKEIEKWRQKLSPYIKAVQYKLYKEQQWRENEKKLMEVCNGKY